MLGLIKSFIKRALKFEENAKWNLEQGDYNLAVLHVEQAAQLMLKAKLLELIGDFPKTHNLVQLVKLLYEVSKKEEVAKFLAKNKIRLARLTDAYVSSRYFAREFYREEAEEALSLLDELKKVLGEEND